MSETKENEEIVLNKTKINDLLRIDPRNIIIEDGFNVREDYGDITELMHSLLAQGQIEPITVAKVKGEDKYLLTDGHRRMSAIMQALEQGYDFPYVTAVNGSKNLEDRAFEMVITGIGKKPLTTLEEAEAYKRIKAFGYDVKEIAKRVAKTQQHVYNLLRLAEVPKVVKTKITEDKIGAGTVLALLKDAKTAEDLITAVDAAVAAAEEEHIQKGGTVETAKTVKAKASHAGKLSAQKLLEKALAEAERLELNNVDLLKKIVTAVQKGYKPETVARYFE